MRAGDRTSRDRSTGSASAVRPMPTRRAFQYDSSDDAFDRGQRFDVRRSMPETSWLSSGALPALGEAARATGQIELVRSVASTGATVRASCDAGRLVAIRVYSVLMPRPPMRTSPIGPTRTAAEGDRLVDAVGFEQEEDCKALQAKVDYNYARWYAAQRRTSPSESNHRRLLRAYLSLIVTAVLFPFLLISSRTGWPPHGWRLT